MVYVDLIAKYDTSVFDRLFVWCPDLSEHRNCFSFYCESLVLQLFGLSMFLAHANRCSVVMQKADIPG